MTIEENELRLKSELYNMRIICILANVNYETFRGWKCGRQNMSKEKIHDLLYTMKNAYYLYDIKEPHAKIN